MKLSPQITQINTDYKKIKKNQCNQCNLWTIFFNFIFLLVKFSPAPVFDKNKMAHELHEFTRIKIFN